MPLPSNLLFHQARAAYRCITLGLGVGKGSMKRINVILHVALHLLRLLLLLSTFGSEVSLQPLNVSDGPAFVVSDICG